MRSLFFPVALLAALALALLIAVGVGFVHFSRVQQSSPTYANGLAPRVGTTDSGIATVAAPTPSDTPAREVGAVVLHPREARLSGPGLRLNGGDGDDAVLTWQDDPRARVTWDFECPAGWYDLDVTYSTVGESRSLLAGLGGSEFCLRTASTGLWSESRADTVGRARLVGGRSQLTLRQVGRGGPPVNLLRVRLVPAPALPEAGVVPPGTPDLPDGSVAFGAVDARVNGGGLHVERECLTNWSQQTDDAEWGFEVARAGLYVVCLVGANAPDSGGPVAVEVGGSTLRGRAASTGSFRTFRRNVLGAVWLAAGSAQLTVKPDGPVAVGLMNLRRVELVPAEAAAMAFDPSTTPAASSAGKTYKVSEEGFVRDWLVLGPIRVDAKVDNHNEASCREFFDRELYAGQTAATPREGDAVNVGGASMPWTATEADDYFVDLGQFAADLGMDPSHAAFLGVAYVNSPKELAGVTLSIGSDDDSMWRLNGKEVIRSYAGRALSRDQNKGGPVTLRQGENVLTFVVLNGGGLTGAAARFLDKDGNPVRDLTVSLAPATSLSAK